MILDCVVGAPLQDFGDLGPLILKLPVHHEQYPLLLFAPAALLDLGIKMIVPPLPALLPNPHRQILRDHGPLLRANLLDKLNENDVFLWTPRSLAGLSTTSCEEIFG